MSLSNTTDRISYTISSLPAALPSSFVFQASSDLLVLDSKTDPATTLTLGSDYTVTGGGYNSLQQLQTGTVTVVAGGAGDVQVGDVITIMRAVPLTQTLGFATFTLDPRVIEQALDKLTLLAQQITEQANRCLRYEKVEATDGTLEIDARKSSLLGFDSTGAITFVPQSTYVPKFGFASTVRHETGAGTDCLDAYATVGLPTSFALAFFNDDQSGSWNIWELVTSTATPGTGIVEPLDNSAMRWFQR